MRSGGPRLSTRLGGALALLWLFVPLVPVLVWSVADRWTFPAALPQEWGGDGWRAAFDDGLVPALLRSLLLGLAVAVVTTPMGVALGRLLGWRLLHRPGWVLAVLLVPLALPPVSVSMGLDVVLLRLGVPEPVAVVLVLASLALPYAAYTSASGFARTSPLLADQARALGATPRQAWWRVVVPAVRGSVLVAALLSFLVGWSDYVVTLLIGGGQLVTAPLLLGSAAAAVGDDATVGVISVATVAPPVVLVLLAATRSRRVGA